MCNSTLKLNNIYKKALCTIEEIKAELDNIGINYTLGFYNNHEIKVRDKWVKEIYPIPVLTLKFDTMEADICVDIIKTKQLAFVELTLTKENILNFDFNILSNINFDIYGFLDYLTDYKKETAKETKQLIKKSCEEKFHIGFYINDINQIINLIKLFWDNFF